VRSSFDLARSPNKLLALTVTQYDLGFAIAHLLMRSPSPSDQHPPKNNCCRWHACRAVELYHSEELPKLAASTGPTIKNRLYRL